MENRGCTVFGCEHAPTDDPKIAVSSGEIAGSAVSHSAGVSPSANYYLTRDGQQYGPYPLETLRQETYKGTMSGSDFVWAEGMADWVPLSQVLGRPSPPPQLSPPALPPQYSAPSPTPYHAAPVGPVDPCGDTMHFGRLLYILAMFGAFFIMGTLGAVKESEGLALLIFWCIWLPAAVLRSRDVGMSGWMVLLLFVPIANLFVGFRLLLAPRGYAITKQPDTALRVMTWVFVCLLVLVVSYWLIYAAFRN